MTNRITRGEGLVGSLTAGDDVTVGDDLFVGDDASVSGDLTVTGALTAGGTIDLGSPVSNIADPTGGDTQDAEARTAIAAILNALEAVGIMAEAE
jgi:hypothetical protein